MRIVILCFVVGFAACQTPSGNQSGKLKYVNLYLRYDDSSKNLVANAMFKADSLGTHIPSGVRLQGVEMESQEIDNYGYRYSAKRKSSAFESTYTFQFNDLNGENRESVLQLNQLDQLAVYNPVSKSEGLAITWAGKGLSEKDVLVILLTDSKGKVSTFNFVGKTPNPVIKFPAEQITGIAEGPGSVSIVHRKKIKQKQQGTDFTTSIEHYFSDLPINVSL